MNAHINLFLIIKLSLSEFVLIQISNVGGPHLLKQFRSYFLNHPVINSHILWY